MGAANSSDQSSRKGNPMGTASIVVSLFSLLVCLYSIWWVRDARQSKLAESAQVENRSYADAVDRNAAKALDTIDSGVTFLGQTVVFVAGFLVGGTLAIVGFGMGIVGIGHCPRWIAITGLALSGVGPLALFLFLCLAAQ